MRQFQLETAASEIHMFLGTAQKRASVGSHCFDYSRTANARTLLFCSTRRVEEPGRMQLLSCLPSDLRPNTSLDGCERHGESVSQNPRASSALATYSAIWVRGSIGVTAPVGFASFSYFKIEIPEPLFWCQFWCQFNLRLEVFLCVGVRTAGNVTC